MDAPPNVLLGAMDGASESGVRGWGPAYVVGRAGDEREGSGWDRTRRWLAGVSSRAVLATDEGRESVKEEEPARRLTIGTVIPEYPGAHADYTNGTVWLGRKDWTLVPLEESLLGSARCGHPQTELLLVWLLKALPWQPDVPRLCMVAYQSSRNGQKLVKRRIWKGPLHKVPSEYRCDRTIMTTTHEMIYIQRASMWCLDGCTSDSGKKGELDGGGCERGTVEPTARDVPAVPYWPSRLETFHGGQA